MRLPRACPWLIVCGALIVALGAACSSTGGDAPDLAALPLDSRPTSTPPASPTSTVTGAPVPAAWRRVDEPAAGSLPDEPPAASLPVFDAGTCEPTRPPLAVAPDGSGFLALSQGFILLRYDSNGCHVADLVLGITTGYARDIAWSPAGDRFAYAIDSPSKDPGCIYLNMRPFVGATLAEHCFPLRSGRVALAWSPDGSRLAMLNGTLLIVADEDGDVVARLTVDPSSGRPRWTDDGETLILSSGDSTEEQRFTRDGAPLP